jgi:hypothetical protein
MIDPILLGIGHRAGASDGYELQDFVYIASVVVMDGMYT